MPTKEIENEVSPEMGAEIKLEPLPGATKQARNFVREHLIKWGFSNGAEDASLIANELVSNAIIAAPKTPFWLTLWVANGWPMLEVADCSPRHPERRSGDVLSGNGRGLLIVEALAVAWDSYPVSGGKVVWAQLRPE